MQSCHFYKGKHRDTRDSFGQCQYVEPRRLQPRASVGGTGSIFVCRVVSLEYNEIDKDGIYAAMAKVYDPIMGQNSTMV